MKDIIKVAKSNLKSPLKLFKTGKFNYTLPAVNKWFQISCYGSSHDDNDKQKKIYVGLVG